MKKMFLIVTVFLASHFAGNAQNARFGFTAGASFANYNSKENGQSDNGNSKTGLTAGMLVDIPLTKHFSFQPAINFIQKGTKDEQTSGSVTEKVSLVTNHIEVPLNFLYNSAGNTGNFFIGAGPSLAFGISGKLKYDDGTNSISDDVHFGSGDDDILKGLDLGANFIAGYGFTNGLFFSVNYNAGLNNLSPDGSGSGTLKSHYFGIRLGYLLNGKKGKK